MTIIPNQFTCDYCEEELSPTKAYMCIVERKENWEDNLIAYGHKYCMMGMKNAYDRTGKLMTQKEVEAQRFDPMI